MTSTTDLSPALSALLGEAGEVVYVVPFKDKWGKQRRTRDGIIGLGEKAGSQKS